MSHVATPSHLREREGVAKRDYCEVANKLHPFQIYGEVKVRAPDTSYLYSTVAHAFLSLISWGAHGSTYEFR